MRAASQPEAADLRALVTCLTGAMLLACLLYWPLPLSLGAATPESAFGDSHAWGLDHAARMVEGALPFGRSTDRAGFPVRRLAPVLGWGPALLTLPLRWLGFSAVSAAQLVLLGSPALAAAAAWLWMRRALGVAPAAATWAALAWAGCAPILANYAAGNIDKVQLWVYPTWLLLAHEATRERPAPANGRTTRLLPTLLAVTTGLVALLAAFTEPYLGLFLPLLGVPVSLVMVASAPDRRAVIRRFAAVFVCTALGLAPASAWFAGTRDATVPQVYTPASTASLGDTIRPGQAPVIDPWALLGRAAAPPAMPLAPIGAGAQPLPEEPGATDTERPLHVVYVASLALAALAGLVALGLTRRKPPEAGRSTLLALLVATTGLVIGLGPRLLLDGRWQQLGHHPYWLPMAALETLHYPLRLGGQYYRAAPLLALGLAATFGLGFSRIRPALQWGIGPILTLALLLDAVRASESAWPRPLAPIDGRDVCAWIAAAPVDPATPGVLTLPLDGTQAEGGRKLLLAALHGRPTSALPLHLPAAFLAHEYPWLAAWTRAVEGGAPGAAATVLLDAGYGYVLHTPAGSDRVPTLQLATLTRVFGPPDRVDGPVSAWNLQR